MGFAKPIEQIFIKLSRYIYVSKRYYTREKCYVTSIRATSFKVAGGITMQDYNTIIGSIQMRLNGCQTRSVMERYKIGSGTLNLIMSRYHANGIPVEELRMMAPKKVVLKNYMRNGCLLIGEKTAILYKIHHSSILFFAVRFWK